jgi:hypothetical protein
MKHIQKEPDRANGGDVRQGQFKSMQTVKEVALIVVRQLSGSIRRLINGAT